MLIQTPHASVIELVGEDRARATTTIHEVVRGATSTETSLGDTGTGLNFEQYGVYFDEVERIDGVWKFTHRRFVAIYIASGGVTGDLLASRSSLAWPD